MKGGCCLLGAALPVDMWVQPAPRLAAGGLTDCGHPLEEGGARCALRRDGALLHMLAEIIHSFFRTLLTRLRSGASRGLCRRPGISF